MTVTLQDLVTEVLALPRSSTGQQGYVSVKALKLMRDLREAGAKIVVITGARSSTLLERLPYLPAADAVVSENGGRIFYVDGDWPSPMPLREDMQWRDDLACATGSQAPVLDSIYSPPVGTMHLIHRTKSGLARECGCPVWVTLPVVK